MIGVLVVTRHMGYFFMIANKLEEVKEELGYIENKDKIFREVTLDGMFFQGVFNDSYGCCHRMEKTCTMDYSSMEKLEEALDQDEGWKIFEETGLVSKLTAHEAMQFLENYKIS